MCQSCDIWVRARRDPFWVVPKGIPRVKRPPLTADQRAEIKLGRAPRG